MLLSVIIAAYNAVHSLADTLNPVLQLPPEKAEIITINDGRNENIPIFYLLTLLGIK